MTTVTALRGDRFGAADAAGAGAHRAAGRAADGTDRASTPPPPAPARLLLVEDEPGLAEVLELHLRAAGFAVDVAADGLAALEALARARPDAVLLDLTLPHVSGFRLLQLLRRDAATATVPVLVLTALSFQEAQEVARDGADDFLTKPVAPQAVVGRAAQLLARTALRLNTADDCLLQPLQPG
jgi:DNA-binding response OmpR family regulator